VATTRNVEAMARAVELASRGRRTAPNPVVGAVVLDASGRVAGEGWHEQAGGPHAEVIALAQAGERARGGTMVVTLEPCHHTGRTAPCTAAVIDAGIRRVLFAVPDPTDAGGGAAALTEAGLEARAGLLAGEATQGNLRWLTAVRRQRPWVVWKVAATLDGRVAAADGTSRWISSPESRSDAHELRAACDTIVAGIGTVLTDDAALTVRDSHDAVLDRQPTRVVVDSGGRTPPTARVRDDAATTWVATAAEVGAADDGRVDLGALCRELFARGSRVVLLEGGPTLAGSFVGLGLVDEVVAYVAPSLLGAGRSALTGTGIDTLADAHPLRFTDVRSIGPDVRITALLSPAAGRLGSDPVPCTSSQLGRFTEAGKGS
jgi:diaminohydroxyphosphoribosylaminopyrimidine deaminase / 5-amino-6-(5-phosphoribosylamino)uracil reductase